MSLTQHSARIFVVEKDLEQQQQLVSLLSDAGHEVGAACNGTELAQRLTDFSPDIVLLDCSLHTEQESAVALAAQLHARYGTAIGIIMIAALNNMSERIACRRAGADHYLVKPVVIHELLAIIRNLSRRLRPVSHRVAWHLSLVAATLTAPGQAVIPLTAWELAVLRELAAAPDHQISRSKLVEALGKNPDIYDQRALEAGISRLRKKLPPSPDGTPVLQALRSIGYRFNRPLTF